MKKIVSIILALMLSSPALAEVGTKRIEWYFKPTCDNSRPLGAVSDEFLKENGAFYLGPDEKKVYLTFDLGYENDNVGSIIETLRSEGVKATFFVLRHTVVNGKYLEEILSGGHAVANHTSHHKDMSKIGDFDVFKAELVGLEEDFKRVTGKDILKVYRPPCGAFSERDLVWAKELGYRTALWSLAYADWDEKAEMSPEAALNKLLSRMHNGAVILLHPTSSTNAKMLPELIKALKEQGYEFGTLGDDCFGTL